MNRSNLVASPSSHTQFHPSLVPSPFFTSSSTLTTRRRFRVSLPRRSSSSSSSDHPASSSPASPPRVLKELKGIELLVDKLSPPMRLATSDIIVARTVAAGYGLGSRFGGSRNAALGGSVALGVAGGAAADDLNSSAPQVAAVNLHNYVAGFDDPAMLNKEDIEAIANKMV